MEEPRREHSAKRVQHSLVQDEVVEELRRTNSGRLQKIFKQLVARDSDSNNDSPEYSSEVARANSSRAWRSCPNCGMPSSASDLNSPSPRDPVRSRSMGNVLDAPPDIWKEWLKPPDSGPSRLSITRFASRSRSAQVVTGEMVQERGILKRFVMPPSSVYRMAWDLLSIVMLVHDICTIPLEAFSLQDSEYVKIIAFVTTVFWTLDIPISFLKGYYCEGVVEMRPSRIAKRYLQSWFTFDSVVVTLDWAIFLFTALQWKAVIRLGKTGRGLRIVRILRTARLGRVVKLSSLLIKFFDYIKSELLRTLVGILLMLILLLGINHYLACGWWAISENFPDNENNWIDYNEIRNSGVGYQYLTALHWSLTQFTPAGMEVYPRNWHERIYSIFALLLGVLTFSSFVSSITSCMMYLRNMHTEPAKQEAILREYFQENKISAELGQRVWVYLKTNHFQHKKAVHKKDIALFKLLPESLKFKIDEELYLDVVLTLPFLEMLDIIDHSLVCELCHHAMGEISLTSGDVLFQEGKNAKGMYFVTAGTMDYKHRNRANNCSLNKGDWACEPVLWMRWAHRGHLIAHTSCEVVSLESALFRSTLGSQLMGCNFIRTYAEYFQYYLKEIGSWDTDIFNDKQELIDVVNRAIQDSDDELPMERMLSTSVAEPRNEHSAPGGLFRLCWIGNRHR